jgi:hypothetical protein
MPSLLKLGGIAILVLLAGCGSNERSITVTDGNGQDQTITVGEDDGTTTVKTEGGTAEITSNADGVSGAKFPDYAPQYPGSTVTSTANFAGKEGEGGAMTVQETADEPAKVMGFYKDKLARAGQKVSLETTTPEGGMIGVEGKDNTSGMMIMVARAEGKTSITYMASR